MTPETARLVLLGFALLLLHETPVNSCASMEDQPLYPDAPTLEINILEYPNENILPTGYNITIICTSNHSKVYWGNIFYGQPYWIQQFFNDDYIGYCGGGDTDSEDSKVCTYVIQNSTERDSGNYSCISRNQMTCTYGIISLKFKEPSTPKFTLTPPHHINASAGSIVNLTCEATGVPRPVITWYKDGRPVPMEYISEVNRISMLTLDSVRPDDQGEYWCEAQNAEGWNKSSRTRLNMLSKPTILLHPKNVSVYLEDKPITVIFTCQASGFPPPMISWVKNDSPISSGSIIQKGSTSSLVLRLLKWKETPGVYKCIVKNSLGEASSKEGALVIRTQTHDAFLRDQTFYLHPESVQASPGDDVVFLCAVQGSPVPRVTWLKDGIHGQADYFRGKESATSVLKIFSVADTHRGRYACKATSPRGNVTSKKAMLSIKDDKPTSSGVSKALCISIATGSGFLFVMVILIYLVHNKCKQANYKIGKEINEERRSQFPHLQIKEGTMGQIRDSHTAPHYQMTNMANEI